MTTTLSPQSTCGVKVGRCLPRRRSAISDANRPTTRPEASISTHFLSISAGLAENVAMTGEFRDRKVRKLAVLLARPLGPVNALRQINHHISQCLMKMVFFYHLPRSGLAWDRIGRRDMGHRRIDPLRPDDDF